jgi:hypothetical protein
VEIFETESVKVTREIYVGVLLVLVIAIINSLISLRAAFLSLNSALNEAPISCEISVGAPEPGCKLDISYVSGVVLSDEVEQVIVNQNLLFKKLLVCFSPVHSTDFPGKLVAQYNSQIIQNLQVEPKAIFCCRLQI